MVSYQIPQLQELYDLFPFEYLSEKEGVCEES
jgi:hypothetical protein